jgi:hypothetical protein
MFISTANRLWLPVALAQSCRHAAYPDGIGIDSIREGKDVQGKR